MDINNKDTKINNTDDNKLNNDMKENNEPVSSDNKDEAVPDSIHKEPEKMNMPFLQKPSDSNYQISLVNENLLKVTVTTKRSVKINSSVKEINSFAETQNNEIYLYPKLDYTSQEVEVMIHIEDVKKNIVKDNINDEAGQSSEKTEEESLDSKNSNYQINLINENLLKVRIITNKGIGIDSIIRDKKTLIESQSSKIYLKPKSADEVQEVDITISIDAEKIESQDDILRIKDSGRIKLIPNPEVMDLINAPDYSSLTGDAFEEISDAGFKNPFDLKRKQIRKNLTIGIIAAVILHAAIACAYFYTEGKKPKNKPLEEQSRLIVIQDLPDPKINLEDIDDPIKPKPEEVPLETGDPNKVDIPELKREPPRRIIKPPQVNRPEEEDKKNRDTTTASDLERELDSLRKLIVENKNPDTSSAVDTAQTSTYEIPESQRRTFSQSDIGIDSLHYPSNWVLTYQEKFTGFIIADTSKGVEGKSPLQMFFSIDTSNMDFQSKGYTKEFKMNDSTLSAFLSEKGPYAGVINYNFYVINKFGTEKLVITTNVNQEYFDEYKNQIEAVIRSIRIRRKVQADEIE